MASLNIMPVMTDALMADCASLSDERFGQYVRLLVLWWRDGCKPSTFDDLEEITGLDQDKLARLKRFLTETPEGWVQKKLFDVYADQMTKAGKMSGAGKIAAKARWARQKDAHSNAKDDARTMRPASSSVCDADAAAMPSMNHEPSSVSSNEDTKVRADKPAPSGPSFDEFWKAYPRRQQEGGALTRGARKKAEGVWARLSGEKRTAALAGLPGYRKIAPDKSRAVVDAERYLRDERWRDADAAHETAATPIAPGVFDPPFPADPGAKSLAERLCARIGKASYASWFVHAGAPAISRDGELLLIAASSKFRRDRIEQAYSHILNELAGMKGWKIMVGEALAA